MSSDDIAQRSPRLRTSSQLIPIKRSLSVRSSDKLSDRTTVPGTPPKHQSNPNIVLNRKLADEINKKLSNETLPVLN
jgi:hypothetical protein